MCGGLKCVASGGKSSLAEGDSPGSRGGRDAVNESTRISGYSSRKPECIGAIASAAPLSLCYPVMLPPKPSNGCDESKLACVFSGSGAVLGLFDAKLERRRLELRNLSSQDRDGRKGQETQRVLSRRPSSLFAPSPLAVDCLLNTPTS